MLRGMCDGLLRGLALLVTDERPLVRTWTMVRWNSVSARRETGVSSGVRIARRRQGLTLSFLSPAHSSSTWPRSSISASWPHGFWARQPGLSSRFGSRFHPPQQVILSKATVPSFSYVLP